MEGVCENRSVFGAFRCGRSEGGYLVVVGIIVSAMDFVVVRAGGYSYLVVGLDLFCDSGSESKLV